MLHLIFLLLARLLVYLLIYLFISFFYDTYERIIIPFEKKLI